MKEIRYSTNTDLREVMEMREIRYSSYTDLRDVMEMRESGLVPTLNSGTSWDDRYSTFTKSSKKDIGQIKEKWLKQHNLPVWDIDNNSYLHIFLCTICSPQIISPPNV